MKWLVVGAGSGGCVAARRLHDAGHEVIVVEAGPPLTPGEVPRAGDGDDSFAALGESSRVDLDVSARRSIGQPARPYPGGRGVGGSSVINGMVALAGSHDLYRSWGWSDTEAFVERILVPIEHPSPDELGRVDRLLLAASPDAAVVPLTRRGGRRVTVAEAYLWPCRDSSRLRIIADEIVDTVTFDSTGVAATGVRTAAGRTIEADAVVLAAGAIRTPTILLRSDARAPSIGESLQDHPAVALRLEFSVPSMPSGLVTASSIEADATQILGVNHLGGHGDGFGMLMVALTRPVGTNGRVRLRSTDPRVTPIVEFDHLREEADLEVLRRATRAAIDLASNEPFASAVANVYIDEFGTHVDRLDDDDDFDRALRTKPADYLHAACSCSKSIGEAGAVVGHDGLFVCDASAFPSIPDANTHVPTMMLAERFASMWLESL